MNEDGMRERERDHWIATNPLYQAFGIDIKIVNSLRRSGLTTVDEVLDTYRTYPLAFMKCKNMGALHYSRLIEAIEKYIEVHPFSMTPEQAYFNQFCT